MGTSGAAAKDRRRAVRSLRALLQRGITDAGDADELAELYPRALRGRGISIGQRCEFGPWANMRDLDPAWMAVHTRLSHLDPCARFLASSPAGTPFITHQRIRGAALRTELHHEFLRLKFADSVVQRFTTSLDGDVFIAVFRPKEAGRFDEDDELLVRMLDSDLGAALTTRSAMHALRLPGAAASDGHAFVSFPQLDVRLDPNVRSLFRDVLGDVSEMGWQRIEALTARLALELFHGELSCRSRFVLPNVRAELAWVPPGAGESHRALVHFFREAHRLVLDPAVAELLTPMQRRVAERAARGMKKPEIARELAISFETARTHLREAMRRLAVSRPSELAVFLRPRRGKILSRGDA